MYCSCLARADFWPCWYNISLAFSADLSRGDNTKGTHTGANFQQMIYLKADHTFMSKTDLLTRPVSETLISFFARMQNYIPDDSFFFLTLSNLHQIL